MQQDIKISVIIASYNYEDLIGRAIESILAQTYDNWEIIIVDDGSKDNSLAVIKKYTEKHDNIYLYQHINGENKGLKETVKLGLKKSTGNYIAFLECDDYWENNYLEEKVKVLEKYPEIKLIFNDVELFGDETGISKLDEYFMKSKRILQKKSGPRNILGYFTMINLIPSFSCVFVERNTLQECDFDTPIDALLDWWLWSQITFNYKVFYVNKKLTNWMIHPKSYLNTSSSVKNKAELNMFFDELFKMLFKLSKNNFNLNTLKLHIYRFFRIPRINKLFRSLISKLIVVMEA